MSSLKMYNFNPQPKGLSLPEGFTVEDVLRSAFSRLHQLAEEMERLAERMANGDTDPDTLKRYGSLSERFEVFGGYDTDVAVNKIANGLSIPDEMRKQLFDSLSGGEMNALVRTTVAFTQASGSSAPNVIPPSASMTANLRLNPMDTVESATEYIRQTIKDDSITITVKNGTNPSPISKIDCDGWNKIASSVATTWQGCIVSPYLMVQCSDSRHYGAISDRVYRFSAMDLTSEERKSIHGHNERIRVDCIARATEFYIRLMRQC